MFRRPVVIVDIETTGHSAATARMTEISALKVVDGKTVDTFTSLVHPGQRIPQFITRLTGIDDAMVADAPSFDAIADQVDAFFEDAVFLAHHAVFDMSFIKREMGIAGYDFNPPMLCSVKLSRALYPGTRGHSLEKIIARHNIQTSERHRAYDDAKAVFDFLQIALDEKGQDAFDAAVAKQYKAPTLPANLREGAIDDIKNVPGVYIFKDKEGLPIYIGKSTRLRSRVLSHLSQATKDTKELKIAANTYDIEVIETPSELDALVLESKLIKEKLPVYNVKLRRKRLQTVLILEENQHGYSEVHVKDTDLSSLQEPETIFGVYDTRGSAKQALLRARDTFDLCSKLLRLETGDGACFRLQLGKCKGACVGQEVVEDYNQRVQLAFARSRLQTWKYQQPIIIKTSDTTGVVVNSWRIIGSVEYVDGLTDIDMLDTTEFDYDICKILQAHIRKHPDSVFLLNEADA